MNNVEDDIASGDITAKAMVRQTPEHEVAESEPLTSAQKGAAQIMQHKGAAAFMRNLCDHVCRIDHMFLAASTRKYIVDVSRLI